MRSSFVRALSCCVALASAPSALGAPQTGAAPLAAPVVAPLAPAPQAAPADQPAPAPQAAPDPVENTPPAHVPPSVPSYLRQTPQSAAPPLATKSETNIGLRATIAVVLLLALGGAALFLRKKQKSPIHPSQVHLSMVAAVGVGNKAQVCLVTVGREAILLGVTEQSVTPLRVYPESELALVTAEVPTTEAEEAHKAAPQAGQEPTALERNFQALLVKASQGTGARSPSRGARSPAPSEREEELPAHLRAALETPAKAPREAFAPPEGQASELARRFRSFQA